MVLRYVIAVLLGLHGLIHTMDLAATWRLGQITAISSTPRFPSVLAPSRALPRLLGVLRLLVTINADLVQEEVERAAEDHRAAVARPLPKQDA